MYYYPVRKPRVHHDGRRADPARFVPPHPDTWAQIYPRPSPEVMTAHNRLWDAILRHPNPIEAINQCMELLTDGVEDIHRPRNEVKEEQNGHEEGQQDEHVVGPEPGEYGGMPPQGRPPPYQPHGVMPSFYGDPFELGRYVAGVMPGGVPAGLHP